MLPNIPSLGTSSLSPSYMSTVHSPFLSAVLLPVVQHSKIGLIPGKEFRFAFFKTVPETKEQAHLGVMNNAHK